MECFVPLVLFMVFVEAWQNVTSVALVAWAVVAMMAAGFVRTGLRHSLWCCPRSLHRHSNFGVTQSGLCEDVVAVCACSCAQVVQRLRFIF